MMTFAVFFFNYFICNHYDKDSHDYEFNVCESSDATLPGLENQFHNQAPGDLYVKLGIKSNYNICLLLCFGNTCIVDLSLKQINKGR